MKPRKVSVESAKYTQPLDDPGETDCIHFLFHGGRVKIYSMKMTSYDCWKKRATKWQ